MSDDPFAPIGGSSGGGGGGKPPAFVAVMPVPADAPPPPARHYKLGQSVASWVYRDAAGGLIGFIHRFDTPDGKQFRPLVLFRDAAGGVSWRWEGWPVPRPLYGLDRLAGRPDAPVVVCEGEKSADAAGRLLPSHVAVTSPNGSKSAGKADWSPLAARRVFIWPDADEAGQAYADAVAKHCHQVGAASVAIIDPGKVAEGWDAADAEAAGWDAGRASAFVRMAKAHVQAVAGSRASKRQKVEDDSEKADGQRRTPQRDIVMSMTEPAVLWRGDNRRAFATFPVGDRVESWPVRSQAFRDWLVGRVYDATGSAPGGQGIEDALRVLEAKAARGIERDPWLRVGGEPGRIYLDMGDAAWRAVEIDGTGWRMVERSGLPFLRPNAMRAQVEAEGGSAIEALRGFVNVATEDDFRMIVAWLLAALRPRGPYPILVINGEQGSGKSVFSTLLRTLIDPNSSPIRSAPGDDRDLIVMAKHSHLVVLDNLSKIEPWMSDGLCRLATGGGFSTRMLHSDSEEVVFMAVRPIVLNGIPSLTDRPDLAERAVHVRLAVIPETERQPEEQFWAAWEAARPHVLGALYDAVSRGLGGLDAVRLDRLPRMADFVRWVVACEPGLGWEPGTFVAAYDENRREAATTTFEADSVAVAIEKLMRQPEHENGWTGTAAELLPLLTELTPIAMQKSRAWPNSPQGLGNRIDRVAPLLRSKSILIERKHSTHRLITIVWKLL